MARDGQPKERVRGEQITNDLPPVWKHEKEGDELAGWYRGSKEITYGDSKFLTHLIEDDETGEILSFSGAIADRKMSRVKRDKFVWVTFNGIIRSKNGKTKDYTVTLEEGEEPLPEKLS